MEAVASFERRSVLRFGCLLNESAYTHLHSRDGSQGSGFRALIDAIAYAELLSECRSHLVAS